MAVAFSSRVLDALFPRFCIRCREEGGAFCHACRAGWIPTPVFMSCRTSVNGLFALGSYKDPVLKGLIRAWKYEFDDEAGNQLGDVVERTVSDYRTALPSVDAVTFVPLHRRRRNERGFDQAEQVAMRVARALGVPCVPLLKRTRYTEPQARLERGERRAADLLQVFACASVPPSRVLLVDDVWTTGATLRSAGKALRDAGAEFVWAFTVAKG